MTITLEKVEKDIQKSSKLPTLPSVATKLIGMVQSSSVNAKEVGTLISSDPSLTARVLSVVNSSYYGLPKQINNVTQAIVLMGFSKLRDVVLTASVLESFQGNTGNFPFVRFWEHSMAAAIAADCLGRTVQASCRDDAFVAGMLHDIGKLFLAIGYKSAYKKALASSAKDQRCIREVEKMMFGFDHSDVGRIVAGQWSFSDALRDGIACHHAPGTSRSYVDLASIVHVADIIARSLLVGSGGDLFVPAIDPAARKELKLDKGILERTVAETVTGLEKGKVFFDLIREFEGAK